MRRWGDGHKQIRAQGGFGNKGGFRTSRTWVSASPLGRRPGRTGVHRGTRPQDFSLQTCTCPCLGTEGIGGLTRTSHSPPGPAACHLCCLLQPLEPLQEDGNQAGQCWDRSACPSTPVLEFPSDVLQQQVTFIFELAAGLQLLVGKAISSSTNSYKGTTELNLDFIHLPLRGTTV